MGELIPIPKVDLLDREVVVAEQPLESVRCMCWDKVCHELAPGIGEQQELHRREGRGHRELCSAWVHGTQARRLSEAARTGGWARSWRWPAHLCGPTAL
eukprot:3496971-Prymnesium_polylepis.2